MATRPRPLIAGNWKMNGRQADGLTLARALAERTAREPPAADLLICPPATLLFLVAELLTDTPVAVLYQGLIAGFAASGAVALAELARHRLLHPPAALVAFVALGANLTYQYALQGGIKAEAAVAAGLTPIVCLGETEAERDAGQALAVVERQLAGSLPAGAEAARLVVAYEPVWAIGTGRTPTASDIEAVHRHLRRQLAGRVAEPERVRLLYGGSVKKDNCAEILGLPEVNGALVGGASLKAEEFWAIAATCP